MGKRLARATNGQVMFIAEKRFDMKKMKIGFIGAGKMAEGILHAIADKSSVIMAESNPARAKEMADKHAVKVVLDAKEVVKASSIVFLSVRPQDVDAVAADLKGMFKASQTLVSIVAGKKLASLRKAFGAGAGLVRVMPNLALRANAGMCAICASPKADKAALAAVEKILGAAGATVMLKEKDFDAVTALSGSGPAYFAYMASAMAEGGKKLGLKADVAKLLALQTMYGTAKFLLESQMPLDPFIAGVATKGGTTAAGMEILSPSSFKEIVAQTLAKAAGRSKELAK